MGFNDLDNDSSLLKSEFQIFSKTICILLLFFFQTAKAQRPSIDLEGEWAAINSDSAYYKNDEIEFHQDFNYYVKAKQCHYVYWKILNKTDLQIENRFVCSEPGWVTRAQEKETFRLSKKRGAQEIEIQRGGGIVDKFKVVEYREVKIDTYPYDTKILRLQRIRK